MSLCFVNCKKKKKKNRSQWHIFRFFITRSLIWFQQPEKCVSLFFEVVRCELDNSEKKDIKKCNPTSCAVILGLI